MEARSKVLVLQNITIKSAKMMMTTLVGLRLAMRILNTIRAK